jgi:hypothetical protein
MQVRRDLLHGGHDVREIRVLGLPQRRRDADVDRVERLDDREIGRRAETLLAHERGDLMAGHVGDVGLSAVHRVDLPCIEVDADRLEAGAAQLDGQRQADIAETDDAGAGAARGDAIEQVGVGG